MLYYKSGRSRGSITTIWCLLLAVMFAWRGQWALHLAAIAVGTADVAYSSFLTLAARINKMEIK